MLHTSVTLIQEPYCPFGNVVGVPANLTLHIDCKPGTRVRSCIVTSKSLQAWVLHQFSDEDTTAIAIRVTHGSRKELLYMASVYMPYDSLEPQPSQKVLQLVNYCEARGERLILGCDTISHHIMWGSTNGNDRGRSLSEYILGTDLQILNEGNTHTFETANCSEVIDVTFGSTNVLNWVYS